MTMINKIWTILNRGDAPVSPQGRKVVPYLYDEDCPNQRALDIMVPPSLPVLEYHFRIEQLVQATLRSVLRERALTFDPLNTYEKAVIEYPPVGFSQGSLYEVFFSEDEVGAGEYFSKRCSIDATTFTVEGVATAYTTNNNLTELLTIDPGKYVRFRGPIIVLDEFLISFTPYLKMPWTDIIARLEDIDIVWPDNEVRAVWLDDYLWFNRIAAVVLAVVEGCRSD